MFPRRAHGAAPTFSSTDSRRFGAGKLLQTCFERRVTSSSSQVTMTERDNATLQGFGS
ncbi:unnamed protein product [Polarella glacialis]|uniref:Uncharacterized protein n=1 Tax=Polarella glacialis TaxID=89957 RepID=A0A813DC83_POLGL|nr:unnamed protein product [Polarella glacialis]